MPSSARGGSVGAPTFSSGLTAPSTPAGLVGFSGRTTEGEDVAGWSGSVDFSARSSAASADLLFSGPSVALAGSNEAAAEIRGSPSLPCVGCSALCEEVCAASWGIIMGGLEGDGGTGVFAVAFGSAPVVGGIGDCAMTEFASLAGKIGSNRTTRIGSAGTATDFSMEGRA